MRIGVDLGGTKIEALALDAGGHELLRRRIPTPQADYLKTVKAISDLVRMLESTLGQQGTVGVGIPGTISPTTGLIKNANSLCLIGHRLDQDLQTALGRPVRLANDANCFALSEATDGAAAGANVVFGAILGTGCGSGIVMHGREWVGPNAIAGEWGHNALPWPDAEDLPGRLCYCGKIGCQETVLSGPGLVADHAAHNPNAAPLSAPDIIAQALNGDPNCLATLERYERRLAKGLAAVINLLDPDVIVLGGGLSNIDRLYQTVPQLWGPYIFSDTCVTKLVKNHHGDSSGVRGAAWLWPEP